MYAISRSSVEFGGILLGIEQLYEQMSDGSRLVFGSEREIAKGVLSIVDSMSLYKSQMLSMSDSDPLQ
jgi:hypothetical protein